MPSLLYDIMRVLLALAPAAAFVCLLLLSAAVYGALVLRDALRHRRRRSVG